MCGHNLNLECHAHIFRSTAPHLSRIKVVFAWTENVSFQDSERYEQVREKALFDQEKQELVYLRDRRNVNRNPSGKVFFSSTWLSRQCTFEAETSIWFVWFRMGTATFKSNTITGSLWTSIWRWESQSCVSQNLYLSTTIWLVDSECAHSFVHSKSQFLWWRTRSAFSVHEGK